jgi:hypothetical protein
MLDDLGGDSQQGQEIFVFSMSSNWLWGQPILGAVLLQVKRLGHERDIHLCLMLTLRMSGPIPLLPHAPACHAQEQLYCCLYFML